jgi:hypothetical protein
MNGSSALMFGQPGFFKPRACVLSIVTAPIRTGPGRSNGIVSFGG